MNEYYLKITVHDNDFSSHLRLFGEYLTEIITYNNLDLLNMIDELDDNHILDLFKRSFLNTYEICTISKYDKNEVNSTLEYLNSNFEMKFILQSDIDDTNCSSLYIQLSGKNKGYYFIY